MQLDATVFLLGWCRLQQKLADAQEDGERGLRSLAERSARDQEAASSKSEQSAAFSDLRRQADLEARESKTLATNDRADKEAEEARLRKSNVNAVNAAEAEEQFRRIAESEREKLAAEGEEIAERTANQRAADAAAEEERRRRVNENPLGSPLAFSGHKAPQDPEALAEENRRAASLLADAAAQAEKDSRAREIADEATLNNKEEKLERKLNQQHVAILTEGERARRIEEAEEGQDDAAKERRLNAAAADLAVQREQNERVSEAERARLAANNADEQERISNQLKAVELTEQERQHQIAASKK